MSMENFSFCSPTEFVVGKGVHLEAGRKVKKYGGTKALIHYGGQSAKKSGLLAAVRKSLEESGVSCWELGGVQPNPRADLVYEGIELCRREGIDFLLAVGGGSSIDSSKAISMGVPYAGDFWDFYEGKAHPQESLPLGVVLTIPAAGSEGSNSTVISRPELGMKLGAGAQILRPAFALMNPELTYTLPPYQTAAGAVDIMAHVMERYFTPTTGVDLTDRLCEAVLKTMVANVPVALADPENYDARANIMWAGTLAHNDLLGTGRAEDWGSHMMEHELSALYDVAHGAGLAVVFPAWLRYQMEVDIPRFVQFANRVFGVEIDREHPERTAERGIKALKAFFRDIGMPTNFKELGAKEEDIPKMAANCHMNNGDKLGQFRPLDLGQIEDIYRMML